MLGRPPFFPSEALAGPASKLLIFYHYLFVFYTLRSWKQQCRGETLLPAAQTRALLPDYDRNRWREPNRQSLQTRQARVRPVIQAESSCFTRTPVNADKTRGEGSRRNHFKGSITPSPVIRPQEDETKPRTGGPIAETWTGRSETPSAAVWFPRRT